MSESEGAMREADSAQQTASALIAAAGALVPMVAALQAKGGDENRTLAARLQRGINQTLDEAADINADDLIGTLSRTAGALANLDKLTNNALAAAKSIARDEKNVQNALSFCSSVVTFGIAVSTGNAPGAATALGSVLQSLKIS